jgi:hypothetical protein
VGNSPESVAVGDFNGDGRLDLAVANFKGNYVSVLLQPPAPEPGVLSSLAFGNHNLGTSATLGLTISNTGTATLNISTSVSGTNSADFTAALNTSSPVSPGGNCSINVTFTPSSTLAPGCSCTISATYTADKAREITAATVTLTDNAGKQITYLTGVGY